MNREKLIKTRVKKASLLLTIVVLSFFPTFLTNISNFSNMTENLREDQDESNDFENLKLSVLGDDVWWNSSWGSRMIINITNPYPYDFENYGVSVTFDYTSLGQNIQSSLNDIRIVENGTLRKYYVKKDYPTTDMATVWFNTNINDTGPGDDIETDTYMYFRNPSAVNAEAIDPSDSFGWIKNGDFELDIDYSQNFNPWGWNFSHNPADTIYGEVNPGDTNENNYGMEFCNKLLNSTSAGGAERVYSGNIAYKFGATPDTLAYSDQYNSYAGALFSYPFTVPRVYGAGIDLHLYRNPRTWGFLRDGVLEEDGYYIRLADNYGPDPDNHNDIGVGYENYAEIWGGRAFYTGPGGASRANNWHDETKLISVVDSTVIDTYSTSSSPAGDLTAPLNFTISNFEGDTIFLEYGTWGSEDKYRSGFFQLDDVRFNYTFSTELNELQYINSTVTIITRDVDGRIVPNVEVMLVDSTISKGSPGYLIAQDTSDDYGRLTFSNLENRRYNITANYTLGSLENEVFNSFELGTGPYYFNGIFYTEEITLNLWTIDFEVVDWDGIPLSLGYIKVNESGGDLLEILTLDEKGKAMFRWLNTTDYYFSVYYDNDDYGDDLLLNESYVYRSNYDKSGVKYQEHNIWVNNTNTDPPGANSYSISEYIYTNGSKNEIGNTKLTKVKISLTSMIDQLEDISVYYIDKDDITGTSNHLIYFEDGYEVSEDSDIIELDIPLLENDKLESENFEVYGLLIEVNGINYSNPCDGKIKVETTETCNIYNRTHLARINIQTIDTFSNHISSVVRIFETTPSQSLINLSASNGYAYDSNDLPFWYLKDRTYNFTIDAYNLTNVVFDVYSVDPPQFKPQGITLYNFTLEKNSTIIFTVYLPGVNVSNYLTSLANGSGTGDAYWGESISFSVIFEYTDDNGVNWYAVTDPAASCRLYICEVGEDIDLITEIMELGVGNGNFTITINSNRLSAGSSSKFYDVRIEGSYPTYPDPNIQGFLLEIKAIPTAISAHDYDTRLELPTKLYTAHYDETVNIMIQYSIEGSGTALDNADLTYIWLGLAPIDIFVDPVYTDFYTFTINTSDALTTGLKVISIMASYENYSTQTDFLVYLNILERETTLNDQPEDLVYISSIIVVQYPQNFDFTYRDANTNNIIGDLSVSTYLWEELYANGTKIAGSFGSGSLTQYPNHSYTLDFNTEFKPVGYYFLYVTLKRDNYIQKNAFINLEIKLREFSNLPDSIDSPALGSNFQVDINQGDSIHFEVTLSDTSRGNIPLLGATVKLYMDQEYLLNDNNNTGVYELTISTAHIDTFLAPQTFSALLYVEMANFTTQQLQMTITIKMQEIWPGMPTFYFILITAAVVGVVGSLVAYRVIQQARIPKHVKKIRKIKSLIKSKKKITEVPSIPTKAQMTAKLFGDDWKEIGLSLEEALGIQDLKSKKLPMKDKISKEGGVNE